MGLHRIHVVRQSQCLRECHIVFSVLVVKVMRCVFGAPFVKQKCRLLTLHGGGGCKALFERCVVQKWFDGRSWLADGLCCPVKWAFLVVTSAHHGTNKSGVWAHGNKSKLHVAIVFHRFLHGSFCNLLHLRIERCIHLQPACLERLLVNANRAL